PGRKPRRAASAGLLRDGRGPRAQPARGAVGRAGVDSYRTERTAARAAEMHGAGARAGRMDAMSEWSERVEREAPGASGRRLQPFSARQTGAGTAHEQVARHAYRILDAAVIAVHAAAFDVTERS